MKYHYPFLVIDTFSLKLTNITMNHLDVMPTMSPISLPIGALQPFKSSQCLSSTVVTISVYDEVCEIGLLEGYSSFRTFDKTIDLKFLTIKTIF